MTFQKILADHAVSALMKQVKRFNAMSVHLTKLMSLAMSQTNEIAQWTLKLINAIIRIQQETQGKTAECWKCLQDTIKQLKAQAEKTKWKILENIKLNLSWIIKANFRLIFRSLKAIEYSSRITRAAIVTARTRINIIWRVCNSDDVIALSVTYSFKTWTESSLNVFNSIIKLMNKKTEQKWLRDIVNIMNELQHEMLMSDEFKNLCDIINFKCVSTFDWLVSSNDDSTYELMLSKKRRLFLIYDQEWAVNASDWQVDYSDSIWSIQFCNNESVIIILSVSVALILT